MPRCRQVTLVAVALCALAVLLPWPSSARGVAPGPAEAQTGSVKAFREGVLSFESPPACLDPSGNARVQGLIGYGPNRRELFREVAGYVDRILKRVTLSQTFAAGAASPRAGGLA